MFKSGGTTAHTSPPGHCPSSTDVPRRLPHPSAAVQQSRLGSSRPLPAQAPCPALPGGGGVAGGGPSCPPARPRCPARWHQLRSPACRRPATGSGISRVMHRAATGRAGRAPGRGGLGRLRLSRQLLPLGESGAAPTCSAPVPHRSRPGPGETRAPAGPRDNDAIRAAA